MSKYQLRPKLWNNINNVHSCTNLLNNTSKTRSKALKACRFNPLETDCFSNGPANKSTTLQENLGSHNNKHNIETKRKLDQIDPIVEFEEETMIPHLSNKPSSSLTFNLFSFLHLYLLCLFLIFYLKKLKLFETKERSRKPAKKRLPSSQWLSVVNFL